MNTKRHIKILKQLKLTDTEKQLLKINLKLLKCQYFNVKRVAIEGVHDLISQVNFRFVFQNYT